MRPAQRGQPEQQDRVEPPEERVHPALWGPRALQGPKDLPAVRGQPDRRGTRGRLDRMVVREPLVRREARDLLDLAGIQDQPETLDLLDLRDQLVSTSSASIAL